MTSGQSHFVLRRIWRNCLKCSSHIAAHKQSCQVSPSSERLATCSFAFQSSFDW